MNVQTPTSDIVNQLKSLSIEAVDRAPQGKASGSSGRAKRLPWRSMLLTGMVAATGLTAWYNDLLPTEVLSDLYAQTTVAPAGAVTPAPVPQTIALEMPAATVAPPPALSVVGSGYVIADRETMLTTDVSGRLVDVRFEIGDTVQKGDVVAVLNVDAAETSLKIAQANLAMSQVREDVAVSALEQARATAKTRATLAQRGNVTQVSVDAAVLDVRRLEGDLAVAQQSTAIAQLEVSKQEVNVARHVLTAPFSGVVVERHLNDGDIVTSGLENGAAGVITLIDPNALTVVVDVAENNLGSLNVGQEAAVSLDAWPNQSFRAWVITIAPKASIQRGTVQVRLSFDTPPLGVFANMAAKVTFKAPQATTENL